MSEMSTRLSWIDESNDESEGDRPLFVKRPDPLDLPRHVAFSLSKSPTCTGYLEKLSSASWFGSPRWQVRYFEVRNLFYFGAPSTSLLGVFDVAGFEVASVFSGVLTLESRNSEVRLRPSRAKPLPFLNEWQRAILEARDSKPVDSKDDGEQPLQQPSLLSQRKELQQKELKNDQIDVAIHHGFDLSPSLADRTNPLQVSWGETKSSFDGGGGGGVELKTLVDDTHSDTTSDISFEVGIQELLENTKPGTSAPIPNYLKSLFVFSGVREGEWPKAVMGHVRLSVFWLLAVRFVLLAYCGWYSFTALQSQTKFLDGCSSSLKFEPVGPKGPYPCVFVINASLVIVVVLSSVAFLFLWLVRHSTDTNIDMLRTHRERIARFVDPIAFASIVFTVAAIITFSITWQDIETDGNVEDMTFRAFYAVGLGFTPSSFLAVATLYYAETRRLRFMIKDFAALVKKKPFNFSNAGPAYKELLSEFDDLNSRMGTVIGVLVTAVICLAAYVSISLYYLSAIYSSLNISLITILTTLVVASSALTVGAQIGANQRSNDLAALCTSLLCTIDPNDSRPLELLLTCIQGSPCELLLFGSRVTKSDIIYLVGFFVTVQCLRFLGLSTIAGQ
eukprot:CAMPEP_0171687752 /NCGR_PEP_ID=MMETSP0991-20121206/3523_1 /TAXON_ID=483369 /ORGANISM="non described non described, Strain CCMP2098" /LENGTH=617 /DNA_ID=CAMNT_0012275635 /DNA_START=81 /DNA_END=1934 /DNA_ORIENTATION=-